MAVHQAYSLARDESLEDLAMGIGSVLSPKVVGQRPGTARPDRGTATSCESRTRSTSRSHPYRDHPFPARTPATRDSGLWLRDATTRDGSDTS